MRWPEGRNNLVSMSAASEHEWHEGGPGFAWLRRDETARPVSGIQKCCWTGKKNPAISGQTGYRNL